MTLDNVRLGLGLALAFTIILLWQAWQAEQRPAPVNPVTMEHSSDRLPDTSTVTAVPAVSGPERPTPDTVPNPPAEAVGSTWSLSSDTLMLDVAASGGDIVGAKLVRYPEDLGAAAEPITLLTQDALNRYHYRSGWMGKGPLLSPDTSYQLSQAPARDPLSGITSLELQTTTPELAVRKRYSLAEGSYVVNVDWTLKNLTDQPLDVRAYSELLRRWVSSGATTPTYTGAAVSTPERRYARVDFDDMASNPLNVDVTSGWVAMLQHYFVSAILPPDGQSWHLYSKALPNEQYLVGAWSEPLRIEPDASLVLGYRYFIGPKLQDELEAAAPNLDRAVDYGSLWIFAKPLWWWMSLMHSITGNWGWAIVLLTLSVKVAFYRLSAASYRSMAQLKSVQPKMQALKDRYKDDAAQLQKAMIDLYRTEKINPLGGCLPILVQAPVFFSLYWVLLESVELRQAPFILWIQDLSSADPYFVLPLIMGVTMFLQARLNPPAADPMQQRMMEIMPVVFTAFTAFFASGLVLYWLVNNVLSILQQWLITRSVEASAKPVAK